MGIKTKTKKWFLILLQEWCVMIFVLCATVNIEYFKNNGEAVAFGNKTVFEESNTFRTLFSKWETELLNYIELRNIFETKGEYNGNKIIDVRQFVESHLAANQETVSIGYYLDDLLKWGQAGLFFEQVNVYVLDGEREKQITARQLVEEYIPADGRSFYEHVLNVHDWEEQYSYLEEAIQRIAEDYLNYKQQLGLFKSDKTNVRFFVADYQNKSIYTNIDDFSMEELNKEEMEVIQSETVGKARDMLKKIGPGFAVDSINSDWSSSLNIPEHYLGQKLKKYGSRFEGNYYVAMAIDKRYLAEDEFADAKEPYDSIKPWIKRAASLGIGAGCLGIALFIALSCMAGREKGSKEVYLNTFDRMKTEIAAGFICFLCLCIIVAGTFVGNTYGTSPYIFYLWMGIMTFLLNSVFLIGYLSLVRRLKAGTFWSNSLLFMWGRLMGDFSKNIHAHIKFALLFTAYLAVSIFLIYTSRKLWIVFTVVIGTFLMKEAILRQKVIEGIRKIASGEIEHWIQTKDLKGDNLTLAQEMNHIGDGIRAAVDANVKNERLKTDLITNVSHDIKTPLTSIINYVDLLKREKIQDAKIRSYIEILDKKSQRLKQLTEDLVEASKISSGNITYHITRMNLAELVMQAGGEFDEKFSEKELEMILKLPDETPIIEADGIRLWRVFENLYNNVAKYAMEGTRVYVDVKTGEENVEFSIKNISKQPLNIHADELTERFIRGDVSRNSEGSGLGLSIAKNLVEAQGGTFSIYLDGDLFRVTIGFQRAELSFDEIST